MMKNKLDKFKYYLKKKEDIVLSYSEFHYTPGVPSEFEYTSAAQLAKHLYQTLSGLGRVSYGDQLQFTRAHLLFTINNWQRCQTVTADKTILFPTVAHLRYTTDILKRYSRLLNLFGERIDRLDSEEVLKGFEAGLERADVILLIGNQTIEDTYLHYGISNNKIITMNYGIDRSVFTAQKRIFDKITFIYPVTNKTLRKGYPFLIKAWEVIQERYDNVELILVGETGGGDSIIEALPAGVMNYGYYKCGSHEHIELLNQAHYVIFPSLSEGQAGSLLEAMACGCVPIVTRQSGIDAEHYSGYVIEPLDDSLSDTIVEIVSRVISEHACDDWMSRSVETIKSIQVNNNWDDFCRNIKSICQQLL